MKLEVIVKHIVIKKWDEKTIMVVPSDFFEKNPHEQQMILLEISKKDKKISEPPSDNTNSISEARFYWKYKEIK
jgi:hypothetical protein